MQDLHTCWILLQSTCAITQPICLVLKTATNLSLLIQTKKENKKASLAKRFIIELYGITYTNTINCENERYFY